jgi:hypothetical protein
MFDSPKGVYYGSQIAAPVFRNIMNRMLNLGDGSLTVQVAEETEPVCGGMFNGLKSIGAAAGRLTKLGFGLSASADSIDTVKTFPVNGENTGRKITEAITVNDEGRLKMPDLKGMTLREAVHAAVSLNLEVDVSGSGIVTAQTPKAGTLIMPGADCVIVCEKR